MTGLSLRKIAGDFERMFRRNVPRNVPLPVALLIVLSFRLFRYFKVNIVEISANLAG